MPPALARARSVAIRLHGAEGGLLGGFTGAL